MLRRRHRQHARRVDFGQHHQAIGETAGDHLLLRVARDLVQIMPSPPASSIGALPIGPPPKNGHSTMASAPLLASHLPLR